MPEPPSPHEPHRSEPSQLFASQLDAVREAARLGPVVDIACGQGRHTLPTASMGLPVVGIDRNAEALRELARQAHKRHLTLDCIRCDLERGMGMPFKPESCGVILVFCFLFRPLAPAIERALAPGGLLLYETFTTEQRAFACGPKNPAFLLEEGELLSLFPRLDAIASGESVVLGPSPRATAQLIARKPRC